MGGSGMSFSQRLNKVPLTSRDNLSQITGKLEVNLRLIDRVHVGSGGLKLKSKDPILIKRLAKEIISGKDISRIGVEAVNLVFIEQDFVRVGNKVCIPGSTIKGLIRSRLELMAGKRGNDVVASACLSIPSRPLTQPLPIGTPGWRHVRIWDKAVTVLREGESFLEEELVSELCPICNLFGAPHISSRVFFNDFYCEDRCEVTTCVFKDYGMRLEVLEPNSVFRGGVILRGVTLEELGLLLIGMGFDGNQFKPVLIGRMKYAAEGFGKVRFEVIKLIVSEYAIKYLEGVGISLRCIDFNYIIDGDELRKLLNLAFNEARKKFPDIEPFSESEEKDRLNVNLNLTRCSV
jgi:hypothetical protein